MNKNIVEIIKNGGVGVLPTDTLYGLVGSAFSKKAVDKIYDLKSRSERKSLIILISSIDDLKDFGVEINEKAKIFMKKFWPGKVSIVLPFHNNKLYYLDKMGGTLAFRLPKKKDLIKIIKETGPIVAPSANPEGATPANNISEARIYFDDRIDFYVDGGEIYSESSTLVKIDGEKIEVLREGAVKIV
ncbi:MAG: L-threonylcarbamoyladenylate synthase [bacterium]